MLCLTYTRLILYLDLLPVIRFQYFIALYKAYNKSKQIAKFCNEILHRFLHRCLQRGFSHFQFFLLHIKVLDFFFYVFAHLNSLGQGFSRYIICCNFLRKNLHIFCLITRFRSKYLDFWKFAIFFLDYWSSAQRLSKNISNVIDFFNNKKKGGINLTPTPHPGS